MKTPINKSKLMKRAWMLYRNFKRIYKTFAAALREAWVQEKRIALRKAERPVRKENTEINIAMAATIDAWRNNGRRCMYWGD